MKELRYPNVKDESEDPALVMARNSLKRKTPEPKVKAKKGVRTCWRCQEPVGKENLTQKWIRRLNAQRFLCDDCIPLKDEVIPGRENEEYRPSPVKVKVNGVEVKGKNKTTKGSGEYKGKQIIPALYPSSEVPELVKIPAGIKQDKEKLMMNLLPFESLEAVAEVLTFGAKKYSPDNWKYVENGIERYEAALLRHLTAHKKGEIIDPDSQCTHLACMACSALFLVWFQLQEEEVK